MRLSCNISSVAGWRLREALPAVRDAGYEAIELVYEQVEKEFAGARDLETAIRAVLEEHGLTGCNLHLGDIVAIDEYELSELVPAVRRRMELARGLEIPSVSFGGGDRERQSLAVFVTVLDVILGEAEELNLDVHLATARGSCIEQPDDLRSVFLEADHPQLHLILDVGQFHACAVNPRDVIREFGDEIELVRISDRIGRRCAALGEGEINVPAVLEHLERIGWDGWLIVQPELPNADAAIRYLTHARRYLKPHTEA